MLDRFNGLEGRLLLTEALRTQSVIGDDTSLAESIAAAVEVEAFKPGAVVMQESGTENDLCFILAGVVSIRVLGREIAVRTAGQHGARWRSSTRARCVPQPYWRRTAWS